MPTKPRTFLALVFAEVLVPAVFAEVPDELLTSPLAAAFGAAPTIDKPKLSPDGTAMIFIRQDAAGASILRRISFADGRESDLLAGSAPGDRILQCDWENDTRLLCELRTDLRPGRGNQMPRSLGYGYQRWYAINSDGTGLYRVAADSDNNTSRLVRNYCLNRILDWLPDDPENVWLDCNPSGNLDPNPIYRLNVNTRRRILAKLQPPRRHHFERFSDGHGTQLLYRNIDEDDWLMLGNEDSTRRNFYGVETQAYDGLLRPVGFGEDLGELLRLGPYSGKWALMALDLENDAGNRLVFAHPEFDVEAVVKLGKYDRVVAAVYIDGRPQRHIIDDRVAIVHEYVSDRLPGVDIEVIDESWDRSTYLVRARQPRRASQYYRVDMTSDSVHFVAAEYPGLAGIDLAETRTIRFEGLGGDRISAHLTLPENRDGPLPAVIIAGGVPSPADFADPNFLAQFLAASGFAVFQVNHPLLRTATLRELSSMVLINAYDLPSVDWDQIADDLNAASKYLVDEGVTVPDRICVVSRDLGAYAAIMSAIEKRMAWRCIVSIGGMMRIYRVVSRQRQSRESSPIRRASELDSPVLLFHGHNDSLVLLEDSISLERALRRADTDVELIEYEHADHDIQQAPYRIDMLTRIGQFLEENIG